jgi:membrane protease YdiL (CAAX protease family)
MTSVQFALITAELLLLGAGAVLLGRFAANREVRRNWLHSTRLPRRRGDSLVFLLFLLAVFVGAFLLAPLAARSVFAETVRTSSDPRAMQVIVDGLASTGTCILAWGLWSVGWRSAGSNTVLPPISAPPPEPPGASAASFTGAVKLGAATFLAILPVLTLTSFGWTALLRAVGLPDEHQDLIDIFAETQSPLLVSGLAALAVVLAPLSEELLFRAGIFRFARDHAPRAAALLLSSILFASLHGNLASFLPLTLLGLGLALAYERAGSLVAPVVLHALFNLNTTVIILSGLPELSP